MSVEEEVPNSTVIRKRKILGESTEAKGCQRREEIANNMANNTFSRETL